MPTISKFRDALLILACAAYLCSTDGPMHYVANGLFWAGKSGFCKGGVNDPPWLDYFRNTVVWPEATAEDMANVTQEILEARLAGVMAEFRGVVESLGFTW